MRKTLRVAMVAMVALVGLGAGESSKASKAELLKQMTVLVKSTKDGTDQKVLFCKPESAEPAPLLVALHSWSASYDQALDYLPEARRRGWVLVAPDFRGPNQRPEACASDLAVQDVLDAVEYAKAHAKVDASRIYLVGGSGGGHMSLIMAGRAPQVWAGVSAWVPIADLAAWHAESVKRKQRYAGMLEKVCGGAPSPQTEAQYRARSPLTYLANAKGVALDVNVGIHDGHTGSVPVSHSLRAFNALAAANGMKQKQVPAEAIAYMVEQRAVPAKLAKEVEADGDRSKAVLFRRVAGPARITVFDGGHNIETGAALSWLARQRKGSPADFSVAPVSPDGKKGGVQEVPK